MNILITGGNGFIGSHVARELAADNHSVYIITRSGKKFKDLPDNIIVIRAEYSDPAIFERVNVRIDVVIHLAWSSVPKESTEFIAQEISEDIRGSVMFFNLCIANRVKKIVFISSGGTVYGLPNAVPIVETHATFPISSYGIGKLCVEKYLQLFNRIHGIDYVILRISNAFGKDQNITKGQGVIGHWIERICNDETIEIWGDGNVVRDYIYISDVVDVIKRVTLDVIIRNEVFNLGSGTGRSLNDILAVFSALKPSLTVQYKAGRKVDVDVNILDITKLKNRLGFQTRYSLAEGISELWRELHMNK